MNSKKDGMFYSRKDGMMYAIVLLDSHISSAESDFNRAKKEGLTLTANARADALISLMQAKIEILKEASELP